MLELENIQEQIDAYIMGTMRDDDKAIFEKQLLQNADLKQEVEVQTSIADAVQAVHLKQLLKGAEAKLDATKLFRRKCYQYASLAASFVIICAIGLSFIQSNKFKKLGGALYADVVMPKSRDMNTLDSLLSVAYYQIGSGEYEFAQNSLGEANKRITEELNIGAFDEESKYQHQLIRTKRYDTQWYQAILLMRQGRVRKAKAIIKEIAKSNGPYCNEAKVLIRNKFIVKSKQQ